MKFRLAHTLAAALLASTLPIAHSQTPVAAEARTSTATPTDPLMAPQGLVAEPVASVSKNDEVANAVAVALNADPALKNSKITVQPTEEGAILLTGSALNEAQRIRATEVARAHAPGGEVINTLAHDEVVIWVPPTGEARLAENAGTQEAATEEPAAATLTEATPKEQQS
ncbi:MAG TPA: BON domain-containing protein [Usitatibacter sp.]|nr:BON domain-containing protein [Usitatibacter sp.]